MARNCCRYWRLLSPAPEVAEESTPWHHPHEILELVEAAYARLPSVLMESMASPLVSLATDGPDETALLTTLLGDDIRQILVTVEDALQVGGSPADVTDTVTYAAGMRLARFAPSNEVSDWFNPQHTFIFSNAVAQAVRRTQDSDVVRSVYDAAVAVYLGRYLNVPPIPVPAGTDVLLANSAASERIDRAALLRLFDERSDGSTAASAVAGVLEVADPNWPAAERVKALVDGLAMATLREDIDFHSIQLLEAATTQTAERERAADRAPATQRTARIFVGVTCNLSAHCPTRRSGQQTAVIARRLQRGEYMYEEK